MNQRSTRRLQLWLALLIALGVAVLTAKKIDLVTADLGRHLANGRWIWQNPQLLFTNFYSYTFPNEAFVNHHWLSGVVFRGIELLGGFPALSLLYVALIGVGYWLLTWQAMARSGTWLAGSVACLLAPVAAFRTEIRPEGFSMLLIAVFYVLLRAVREQRLPPRSLAALPLLLVLWVNLHIYFFWGLLIAGAFWLEGLLATAQATPGAERDAARRQTRMLFWTGIALVVAAFASPFGWVLATYPLRIFANYGYMIVENQSIPFLLKRGFAFPVFTPLYIALALLWLGLLLCLATRRRLPLAPMLLALTASVMAVSALRNLSLFAFLGLPAIVDLWKAAPGRQAKAGLLGLATVAGLGIFLTQAAPGLLPTTGLGLREDENQAADFFRSQGIQGPIFNNYDIGGYLIYHLFPQTRVFVDNRPEAYPESFLTGIYVPMQETAAKWAEEDDRHHFNAVFFYWHDYTPAAQTFLIARVNDRANWAPVYVDAYALILLRRNATNAKIIAQYEIPPERFTVHQ